MLALGFPGLPANAGYAGLIPGLGRFPGGGNGNPLQCSCLENPMARGAWKATVHRVAERQTQLFTFTYHRNERKGEYEGEREEM